MARQHKRVSYKPASSIAVVGSILLSTAHALGQEIVTAPSFPIVVSGNRTRVGIAYHLNADCSSGGTINVRLAEKPKNGVIELVTEQGFTDYERDTQQYKCNEVPSEIQAFYSAAIQDRPERRSYQGWLHI